MADQIQTIKPLACFDSTFIPEQYLAASPKIRKDLLTIVKSTHVKSDSVS